MKRKKRICDLSKEEAEKEYDELCNEYFSLCYSKEKNTPQEKARKYYLNKQIDLFNAIHFGKLGDRKLCKSCNNDFIGGNIGKGIVLVESCCYCFRKRGMDSDDSKRGFVYKNRQAKS